MIKDYLPDILCYLIFFSGYILVLVLSIFCTMAFVKLIFLYCEWLFNIFNFSRYF